MRASQKPQRRCNWDNHTRGKFKSLATSHNTPSPLSFPPSVPPSLLLQLQLHPLLVHGYFNLPLHSLHSLSILLHLVRSGLCTLIIYTSTLFFSQLHYLNTIAPLSTVMSVPHISSDVLDTPISDQDIAAIARDYLVKWEELTPHLGLTAPQEHNIRRTFQEYDDQKREALLVGRETREMGPPTAPSSQLQKPYPTCC